MRYDGSAKTQYLREAYREVLRLMDSPVVVNRVQEDVSFFQHRLDDLASHVAEECLNELAKQLEELTTTVETLISDSEFSGTSPTLVDLLKSKNLGTDTSFLKLKPLQELKHLPPEDTLSPLQVIEVIDLQMAEIFDIGTKWEERILEEQAELEMGGVGEMAKVIDSVNQKKHEVRVNFRRIAKLSRKIISTCGLGAKVNHFHAPSEEWLTLIEVFWKKKSEKAKYKDELARRFDAFGQIDPSYTSNPNSVLEFGGWKMRRFRKLSRKLIENSVEEMRANFPTLANSHAPLQPSD